MTMKSKRRMHAAGGAIAGVPVGDNRPDPENAKWNLTADMYEQRSNNDEKDRTQNRGMPGSVYGGRGPTMDNAAADTYMKNNPSARSELNDLGPTMTPAHFAGGTSGLDRAMSAHADKIHPVKRR